MLFFHQGKKITSKPHEKNTRALISAPRKEFFVALLRRRRRKRAFLGVLFNPFLSKTRFSRQEAEARNHHSVCVLVFENSKRKHSRRRETPPPRRSAALLLLLLLLLLFIIIIEKGESHRRERERERESGRRALRLYSLLREYLV